MTTTIIRAITEIIAILFFAFSMKENFHFKYTHLFKNKELFIMNAN